MYMVSLVVSRQIISIQCYALDFSSHDKPMRAQRLYYYILADWHASTYSIY